MLRISKRACTTKTCWFKDSLRLAVVFDCARSLCKNRFYWQAGTLQCIYPQTVPFSFHYSRTRSQFCKEDLISLKGRMERSERERKMPMACPGFLHCQKQLRSCNDSQEKWVVLHVPRFMGGVRRFAKGWGTDSFAHTLKMLCAELKMTKRTWAAAAHRYVYLVNWVAMATSSSKLPQCIGCHWHLMTTQAFILPKKINKLCLVYLNWVLKNVALMEKTNQTKP